MADPMVVDQVVRSVAAGLGALAQIAPSVAEVFTGGRPVEELLAEAEKRARELEQREAKGGDSTAGTWDRDLARRIAGGAKSEEPAEDEDT